MAVTKLMHMKECAGKNPSRHLKNAIQYILNPQKTKGGLFTGGNCGTLAGEVYEQFMNTKMLYEKNWGRQGYHFVLSFPPDEVTSEQVNELGREFCEKYFQDNYDYVYATHDDQDHKHCHIIFNSVSREGRKYRYEKGDWAKYIQKLTNQLCQREGLSYIKIGESEKKETKARSYQKWESQRGYKSWNNLIRQNIDEVLADSTTYDLFLQTLKSEGYEIREGMSKKFGEYISFKPYGAERASRSYKLGKGYTVEDIKFRIANREKLVHREHNAHPQIRELRQTYYYRMPAIQFVYYKKLYFLMKWDNQIKSPYPQAWKYRKELREMDQYIKCYRYLGEHNITNTNDLQNRYDEMEHQLKLLLIERKTIYNKLNIKEELLDYVDEYQELKGVLDSSDVTEEESELLMDHMEELEDTLQGNEEEIIHSIEGNQKNLVELKEDIKAVRSELKLMEEIERRYASMRNEKIPEIPKKAQSLGKDEEKIK